MIYLDSAATTLEKPTTVSRAMLKALRNSASPGRGDHFASKRAGEIMYRCRKLAAELFGVANPEQVVLTSSATHGLNIAIRTLVDPGSVVLISGYEHNAVTRTLRGIPDVKIRIASGQLFDEEDCYKRFESALTDDVDTVICNHVSNVFGFIQPLERIAQLCRVRRVPLIVDASQSAGILPISLKELGAAFIAMPGHKGLYGPQGTGLLLCGLEPKPLLYGGTGSESLNQNMPEFLPDLAEAGTQNVCGAAGLVSGLEFLSHVGIDRIFCHECTLRRVLTDRLNDIPKIKLFVGPRQSGLVSFISDNLDCESLSDALGHRGIAVRAGLHCAPLAHKTAGTLDTGTVRVSFSAFNRTDQVDYTADQIRRIVVKWRVH